MTQLFLQAPDLSFIESIEFPSPDPVIYLTQKICKELIKVFLEIVSKDLLIWIENIKRINEGKALFDMEEYQEAIELFKEFITKEPKHYEAWLLRSLCLLLMGKLEESIRSFDHTINRKETHQGYHYKAIAQILLQDFDSALESLEKAIQLKSGVSEIWFDKARILEKVGKYSEAIDAYDQAVTIKPHNHQADIYSNLLKDRLESCFEETTEILIKKGSAMIEKSRYEDATAYINKAIEIDAENAEAWSLRGDVLRWNFDHRDAICSYQRAIEINSQLSQPYYGMGMSFHHLKRYGLAYKALKESVNLDTDFSDAYFYLGMASYQLKYWDKANEAFTRFCELSPDDVRGFLYKGHTYRKRGSDLSTSYASYALNAYQEVLSKDPENLQALNCIGKIHLTLDNEDKALETYTKVATLNPGDEFAQSKIWELNRRLERRRLEYERELEYQKEVERQEIERLEMKRRQQDIRQSKMEKELEMFKHREQSKRKWFGLF